MMKKLTTAQMVGIGLAGAGAYYLYSNKNAMK
jgi:hypothetical protein